MKKVLNSINNGIIVCDINGQIKFCNRIMLSILEYSSLDEIQYINLFHSILDSDLSIIELSQCNTNNEFRLRNSCNNIIKLNGRCSQANWNNEEICIFIFEKEIVDINNTFKSIEDLELMKKNTTFDLLKNLSDEIKKRKEQEEEMEIMLSTAMDMMCTIDTSGNFLTCGVEWEKRLGWTKEDFKKENWYSLFHPDELDDVVKKVYKEKYSGSIFKGTNKYRCKNGEYKILSWRTIFVPSKNCYIGSAIDITEERKLEEEKIKLEEAYKTESVKNQFLSNMSHEFKTPLNIINSAVQLINFGIENNIICANDDISLNNHVSSIKHNTYRLMRLLNNILDISNIDNNYDSLKLVNCNIVSVVEDTIICIGKYLEDKNCSIIFDTEVEEFIIACDIDKIQKIILNLISNAIKYSNKNQSIVVNIKINEEFVIISVKDNGIGIGAHDIDNVFGRFKQIDESFTRKTEGSGLGLSLVKSLIELHGGNVWVESVIDKGSIFTFSIPCKLVNESEIQYNTDYNSLIESCNIEFSDIYNL